MTIRIINIRLKGDMAKTLAAHGLYGKCQKAN